MHAPSEFENPVFAPQHPRLKSAAPVQLCISWSLKHFAVVIVIRASSTCSYLLHTHTHTHMHTHTFVRPFVEPLSSTPSWLAKGYMSEGACSRLVKLQRTLYALMNAVFSSSCQKLICLFGVLALALDPPRLPPGLDPLPTLQGAS